MNNCEYAINPETEKDSLGRTCYWCKYCGHERWSKHPPNLLHRPCPIQPSTGIQKVSKKLLGDRVEQALTAVGVTKERVSKWLGRPCKCPERKEKLNLLDAWARRKTEGFFKSNKEAASELEETME